MPALLEPPPHAACRLVIATQSYRKALPAPQQCDPVLQILRVLLVPRPTRRRPPQDW